MENLKIGMAKFENRSGDKTYNLSIIEKFIKNTAKERSKVLAYN